jgi:hypothetical protein
MKLGGLNDLPALLSRQHCSMGRVDLAMVFTQWLRVLDYHSKIIQR